MASRFDEVDLLREPSLEAVAQPLPIGVRVAAPPPAIVHAAPRWRRTAAFLVDLSLFAALLLVLSPLLPRLMKPVEPEHWLSLAGTAGFLLLVSYYYFTGTWLIWGKSIGGAIFDVRVVRQNGEPLDAKSVTTRWLITLASIATAGAGFLPAVLRGGYTFADRISGTRSIRG